MCFCFQQQTGNKERWIHIYIFCRRLSVVVLVVISPNFHLFHFKIHRFFRWFFFFFVIFKPWWNLCIRALYTPYTVHSKMACVNSKTPFANPISRMTNVFVLWVPMFQLIRTNGSTSFFWGGFRFDYMIAM